MKRMPSDRGWPPCATTPMGRGAVLLALVAASACFPNRKPKVLPAPPPPVMPPVAEVSPWPATLALAVRAAEAGRYDEADRLLLTFSLDHRGTPEGAESDFWRALFKSDPLNRRVSLQEQVALLENYLGFGPSAPRYAEALVLRRIVEASDSTRALLQTTKERGDARDRARDEEFRKLNEQYERTLAELERIKRRLAPKP